VFVTLCLFNNIRLVVTLFLPFAVAQLAEALVSIRRLQNFLLLEERPESMDSQLASGNNIQNEKLGELTLEDLSAKWNHEYEENTLNEINLKMTAGQLVAVIGHVGSGKSSLLHSILHELPPTTGHVSVNGSIGYAAQEPWIFAGSVKDNILFGKRLDVDWYEKVIQACALKQDLGLLPHGDNTLVGDKGTSLSGGQKARVALSRAVYANANIYLLDDPLSAVDSEVGRHIFEKCINGILKDKTRILVTHQLQFLEDVSRIVLMENGRIQMEGSYETLIDSGIDFAKLLQNTEVKAGEPESEAGTPLKTCSRNIRRRRTISEGSDASKYSISRYESVALGEKTLLGKRFILTQISFHFFVR